MRTLTIADNWKDWKFGDTDAVMTFTALDDDKVPDFSNRTLTFKIASTLNNDLEHPKDFAATATGYIQGKDVILKTEDVKQLTPGNYIVELWAMSNDTQKDAVYPSKGFAQFTIEENSMKVSDVTNIPSMTINAFWNAVMQKVGTLTKGAKGDPGKTPKIVIGSVTKLSPDAQPSATLVPLQSDPNTYTLNLQLPQGVQGEQGLQGIPGVGSKGLDGSNGLTPTIDPKTKHWMIGNTDTGVIAEGQAGKDADPSKYVTIVSFNQLRQQVQDNATASDANYAALKNLKDSVGAIQAQIDAGNVVTLTKHNTDIDRISKAIEDKLAQMNLQPEAFENEAALKATYPNGKSGLMLTADTGHKWLWVDGSWKDCGVYQAAGVVGLDSIKDLGKLKKLPVTGINTVAGTDKPIVFKATGKPLEISTTSFFGDEASATKLYFVDDGGIYGKKVAMEATYTIDQPLPENAYLQLSQLGIPDWETYLTLNGPKLAGTYTIKQVVTLPELSTIDPGDMPAFQGLSVNYTGTVTITDFRISYCDPGEPDSKPVSKMTAGEAIQQGFVGLQNQLDHLNLDNLQDQDELSKLTAPNISVVDKGDKAIVFHGTGILGENSITNFSGTADDVNQYRIANTSVFGQRVHMRVTYAVDQPVGAGYIQMQLAGNPDWSSYLTLSGTQYTGGSYTIEGTYNLPALKNNDFVVFRAVANNYTGNIRITNFNIWIDEEPSQDTLSNMNAGDRIANALRSTMQLDNITNRKQLDDVQIVGANLDVNSNQDWVEEQFTGWLGINYHSFKNLKPNTNYTYFASIMTDNADHKWTCRVLGVDSEGKTTQIGFNNEPAVANNPEAQVWGRFNTGDYVEIRCYPYLADSIMPVTTIKYRYEMMIEGTYTSMAYKPPYRQYLTTPEALSDMFMSLQSQVDRLNERHLGLPILNLGGKASQAVAADGTYTVPYVFIDKNRKQSGYATISWQGDSSKNFVKKSFKFKTFTDPAGKQKQKWQPTPTFYKSHSFTLKGYYNDKYGFRDSVSAAIQARFVMNNPTAPKELLAANNFGSIQSYPVLLYVDGQFYGLMQLNTKSSSDLWNIDEDNPNQIAMEANGKANKTGALWTHEQISVGENGDFALNSDNDTNAQVNAQKLDTFLVTSTDDDFKAHLDEYVDVNSICDYILFNFYVNNCDAFKAKNTNYLTYDGNRWYMIGYDFDASLGNSWQAGKIIPADDRSAIDNNQINLLKKVIRLMPEKILDRLNYLEQHNVIDVSNFIQMIDEKANQIGTGAYLLDENRWGGNSEYSIDIRIDDIKAMLVTRKALLRKYVESLQSK